MYRKGVGEEESLRLYWGSMIGVGVWLAFLKGSFGW